MGAGPAMPRGRRRPCCLLGLSCCAKAATGVGFLFTVGEEDLSDGAKVANRLLADPWQPRYVIVGEPTGSRFVRGHKGLYHGMLHGCGVAGHSSQDVGPSAVHELLKVGARALDVDWGRHELFGQATLNLGVMAGGVAPNVVADRASLSFLLRAVDGPEQVEARVAKILTENVRLEAVGNAYGPVEFYVPEGMDSDLVAFGTDAPHLPDWGTPVLFGAGEILDAHTDHEKVGRRDLEALVSQHVETAQGLFQREEQA